MSPRSWSTRKTSSRAKFPLDKATPQNIVDQVGDYFGDKKPDAKTVATAEKK